MTEHRRILVVAQTGELASTLVSWLSDSGNDFVLANSYAGAKLHLTSHPDVLITELKLGEYNGLHLALRGQAAGIPTIILGPENEGFEGEAVRLGAMYLSADGLDSSELTFLIEKAVFEHSEPSIVEGHTASVFGQQLRLH
jgi:DNA-binding NtrC family response regulator